MLFSEKFIQIEFITTNICQWGHFYIILTSSIQIFVFVLIINSLNFDKFFRKQDLISSGFLRLQ